MKHDNGYCHLHGIRRKCTHPQCSNYVQSNGLCIQHGYRKKKCSNDGCTNNVIRNAVCTNHGVKPKRYCTIPECGKSFIQAGKCRFHFRCLLVASTMDLTTEDVSAAANAMVCMRHNVSATTSGSVVCGQKFDSIDHDTTIMDITDLTLEVIQ